MGPSLNLADHLVFRHLREGRPTKRALVYRDQAFSYDQVADLVGRCASVFQKAGLGRGDRIVILLPDSPSFVAAFFGSLATGAIAVPLNPAMPVEQAVGIA